MWPLIWKRSLRFAVFEQIWYPFERLGVFVNQKIVIHLNGLGYLFGCLAFLTLRLFRAASAPIIVCTIVINFYFLYIMGWNKVLLLSEKIVIRLNGLGYPFKRKMWSVRTACHPFKRLGVSVQKRNWRLFEQLKLHSNINFSWVSIQKPFRC